MVDLDLDTSRTHVAVLISGRGSNLKALIEAGQRPEAPFDIALVISNRPGAGGLGVAEAAGIPSLVIDHKTFDGREPFERALDQKLNEAGVRLVCLAGFMRLLTPWFVERWRDRLLNIHPSLLPAFKGLDTHARALEAGVRVHGCTVHLVRAELDDGPILVQGTVPVLKDDTEGSLAARVLEVEHQAYPLALDLIVTGRAQLVDGRMAVDGAKAPTICWTNPQGSDDLDL
ncbi:MAG: phosphoribosylglycinamide formyltransferase [Alphaproteobacteria bacterium]|nr:phosphoribosylglycinamide formyltransferase [Alphaproteobacteria bacterium]